MMDAVPRQIRRTLLDLLRLIASREQQLAYQARVPIADVSAELFCRWDDLYQPQAPALCQAFTASELQALADFDEALNQIADATPETLPPIQQFVDSPHNGVAGVCGVGGAACSVGFHYLSAKRYFEALAHRTKNGGEVVHAWVALLREHPVKTLGWLGRFGRKRFEAHRGVHYVPKNETCGLRLSVQKGGGCLTQ